MLRKSDAAKLRVTGQEYALPFTLQPCQRDQPAVDGGIPERGAFLRAGSRALPLQRHGLVGGQGEVEEHPERHRLGPGTDGLQAPAQYRGRADPLLGGHPRRGG